MGTLSACSLVLKRDLLLAFRFRSELLNPLLFFVIVVSLFPLAVSPDPEMLRKIAPGVIWVAALLSTLLSLDSLFRSDYEEGMLDQLLVSPHPVALLVTSKVMAHWLVTGLPLILISPLLGVLLHLPTQSLATLMLSLALGTPILSFIGAIAMALTVSLRKGGILLALLVLPLYIPVLIFGTSAVMAASLGMAVIGQLVFLSALLILALTLAPWTTAAALRIGMSE